MRKKEEYAMLEMAESNACFEMCPKVKFPMSFSIFFSFSSSPSSSSVLSCDTMAVHHTHVSIRPRCKASNRGEFICFSPSQSHSLCIFLA